MLSGTSALWGLTSVALWHTVYMSGSFPAFISTLSSEGQDTVCHLWFTHSGTVHSLSQKINEIIVINLGLNFSSLFFILICNSGDQTTRSAFCYSSLEDEGLSVIDYSGMVDDGISCSHGDYPCRFTNRLARSQRVIPHRVFGPVCLLQKAQVEF